MKLFGFKSLYQQIPIMNISVVSASSQAAIASVLQEAMETAAQTKAEAAKSDPQAQIKMTRLDA